ncbi:malonate decarboxylase holo-[acyl-carrier-protein] synthase [Duganella sp. sic0402]|uniref:malonate decarboxylase holo-[acyl-carrier-protein] synthase n=1 Tax=Duganella sp. sic0402 TaxID=2854786 RepID=UPI001C45B821|nr:malonate decarboxylase holo-[acyl-carrier-protein] synthase [Duganella sp. sic0402]MBV7537732.1 malonate decarboxylase holo-[acyl-carrier-protein] synthase [Duganella sp. sic0402]
MSSVLERHALAWLTADGWQTAMAANPQHTAALAQWRQQDWPVVARRLDAEATDSEVCLGLPLPPDTAGVKVRIALRVHVSHIARASDAIPLRSALPASGVWCDALAALCDEAPDLRVFGSLAMQTLTEQRYVSPSSDIDLLFKPANRQQLEDGIVTLARHAQHLPLDGEIVFPGGAAVSWKEWRIAMAHPAKVMVKELRSVHLAHTASLLATLEAH